MQNFIPEINPRVDGLPPRLMDRHVDTAATAISASAIYLCFDDYSFGFVTAFPLEQIIFLAR
jgi:hypothetical protein